MGRWQWALLLTEIALLSTLVVVGFIFHDGANHILRNRFWAFFVPLMVPWLIVGFTLQIYSTSVVTSIRRIWRPLLCALAALAVLAWGRSLWLDSDVILMLFINVFGALFIGSVLGWRLILYGAIRLWQLFKSRSSGAAAEAVAATATGPIETELLKGGRI